MPAAEWRSKEGKNLTGMPLYDESMGLHRGAEGEPDAIQAAKRQRLEQPGDMSVPLRQIAAPEDDGGETQERVPIPRSSL